MWEADVLVPKLGTGEAEETVGIVPASNEDKAPPIGHILIQKRNPKISGNASNSLATSRMQIHQNFQPYSARDISDLEVQYIIAN